MIRSSLKAAGHAVLGLTLGFVFSGDKSAIGAAADAPTPSAATAKTADPERPEPPESPALRAIRTKHVARGEPSALLTDTERQAADERADWMTGLAPPDIRITPHVRVEKYVRYFTEDGEGRTVLRNWYARSGRHREAVQRALEQERLPSALEAVVFVESGYSPAAVSPAGAVGLWQLMRETAEAYGLVVEHDYDERRSVAKSSAAAARHLSDLYAHFGSWDLALAAYNVGYRAMIGRIREVSTNDFWTIAELDGVLPRETVEYVPKVMAVALVLRNLDRYGLEDAELAPRDPVSDLAVPPLAPLRVVAKAAGTTLQRLRELNPELLTDRVPDRADVVVHVPSSGSARAQALLPRLLDEHERREEPPDAQAASALPLHPREPATSPRSADPATREIYYGVSANDSVASIARTFGIRASDVVRENHLDPRARLQPGMILVLHVPPARWAEITDKRLAGGGAAEGEKKIAPSDGGSSSARDATRDAESAPPRRHAIAAARDL